MKSKKTLLLTSLALMTFSLVACGGNNDDTTPKDTTPTSEKTSNGGKTEAQAATIILTANQTNVELKVDQSATITNFYTLKKSAGSPTAAEKACTYVAEDPTIVKITNKVMKALKVGETKVTVTSTKDKTKTCEFTVKVTNVYFDRQYSQVRSEDEFDRELPEDGGIVRTKASTTADLYVKGIDTTTFIAKCSFTLHSVAASEKYPKFGITCSTGDHAADDTSTNNKMYFFLNAEMPKGESSWDRFGICEVQNSANWAWNPGVSNATARHKDDMYVATDNPITYETEFSLTMIRKNLDFHFFVNDNYAGSCVSKDSLFMNGETNLSTMIGFFEFNSDVTFQKYSIVTDASEVDSAIAAIENPHFLEDDEWAAD